MTNLGIPNRKQELKPQQTPVSTPEDVFLSTRLEKNNINQSKHVKRIYKFDWNESKNAFDKMPTPRFYLEESMDIQAAIIKIKNRIQNRSGIKKFLKVIKLLLCVLFSFIGFAVGYFLIRRGYTRTAGIFFIGTPILVFFGIVGGETMKGGRIRSIESYLSSDKDGVIKKMKKLGFLIFNNFTKRENYFEVGEKVTLKMRLSKCWKPYFVDGILGISNYPCHYLGRTPGFQ